MVGYKSCPYPFHTPRPLQCCRALSNWCHCQSQVEQYGEEYQDQSWGPIIALVTDNRPPAGKDMSSAKDRGTIKELFLTLNGYIQVSLCLSPPFLWWPSPAESSLFFQ